MKSIEAGFIIFDLDGTLIDSSSDIAWAANRTLEVMGYPALDVGRIKEDIGWGVKTLLERLMPGETAERIAGARMLFLEFYGSHLVVETHLYPGVADTIRRLCAMGKLMAVVTNKPETLTLRILEEVGLKAYLPYVVGGDTLPTRKPSPEPVEAVIRAAGMTKAVSVIVGDSPMDAEAGRAAGISAIGVTYGFRGVRELTGFDALVDAFAELKDVIR
ncbi:MAG: HAD-IA family hydrolase [Deltaproteobacteria bacterium]|nr:HAD-IA family hydrolase [Deltaproteobacteria bacterium]